MLTTALLHSAQLDRSFASSQQIRAKSSAASHAALRKWLEEIFRGVAATATAGIAMKRIESRCTLELHMCSAAARLLSSRVLFAVQEDEARSGNLISILMPAALSNKAAHLRNLTEFISNRYKFLSVFQLPLVSFM